MTMYFGLTEDREPLKKILDESIHRIYINNSAFQNRLYNKYFSMSNGLTPVFSLKDKEFIARGTPVKVVLQVDNGPFCFEDSQGNLIGVIPDLYQKLSELSGLKFTYVKARDMQEAIQMVANGQADVIAKMTGHSALAAAAGLRMSRPFMDIGLTQISLKGTSEIRTVGIPDPLRPFFPEEVLSSEGQPLKVVSFSSSKACFEALHAGTIDMAYLNSATANYMLNIYRSSDYNFSSIPGRSYNLVIGIRNDESNELYDIINTCLRYIDPSMLIGLSVKYSLTDENSLKIFINRLPSDILLMVSVILAAMVIGLIALIVTTVRKNRVEQALVLERGKIQRQNQKILLEEQANKERMRFFSTVNHDMRTPLNGVLGYTDLAIDERDVGKIKDYLSKIRISGRILLQLINDILDFGQFASRSLILQPGPVDMGAVCADVETIIKPLAENKKLTFSMLRPAPYAGYVEGDALRLQQIFINLLSNSVKFTNAGGMVEAIIEEHPQADVVEYTITVRDTGIGMSAEFLPRIFDTYAQERRPSASPTVGTGLGMTIVKQIVDKMGGTIHVDSVIDKGSVFTVQLCLKKYAAGKEAPSTDKETVSLDILKGRRVLLCEDNELNAEIARVILTQWGMDVTWVENGAEAVAAVERCSSKQYEIILMDKRMPVMDGVAAAKAIRHMDREEYRSIPILAMTGDIFPDAVQECLDAGMNGCVGKPVDRQKLAQAMIDQLS
jgi:signal transduction histidine kinase/ActR/RegA family two-component response regulator